MSKSAEKETGAKQVRHKSNKADTPPAGKEKKRQPDKSEKHVEDMLDEASDESFPASDPPAWNAGG